MGSIDPNKTAKQKKEARLIHVAELYAKGYALRQIVQEVKNRLRLETYSLSTVKKDVDSLKAEWKEARIAEMDDAINHELYKINLQERELWDAWEKSKSDQKLTSKKQKGITGKTKAVGPNGLVDTDKIVTTGIEKTEKDEINYGDPRYQAEITKLGQERRKLTGMYAAEKKELTGKDGAPLFNGFDAFMADCLDKADFDKEVNEATQQETINSAR
ncbi:hypothetical protein [Pedobacter sp. Leaf132]|uniref:hypothetical protein n=1 Tax=Pedobacter sp. Leaf132 TaxID=2876557 RepID=UPI001E5D9475|nr:hypothetical protein [Pedobacter sp. Leaf132]